MEDEEEDLDDTYFVNELPRDLRCPVCLYVLKNPCQLSCGHRFCTKCIENLKEQSEVLCCPVDREMVRGDMFPDMAAKRHINSLKVKCHHFKDGCIWTGDVVDRKTHSKTCTYATHNCPSCGIVLKVFDLENHQAVCPKRLYDCKYCKKKVPLCDMDMHFAKCDKFPIPCPNNCPSPEISRVLMPSHLQNDCSYALLSCSMEAFGCTEKVRRYEMSAHLEKCAVKHISSLAEVVLKQQRTIAELSESLDQCKLSLSQLQSTCYPSHGQFTWKVDDIRRKIQAAQNGTLQTPDSFLYSPPFFTGEAGYKLCLCIYPAGDNNQGCLSLYFVVMKGPYDEILEWPFQKHVRLILINGRRGHNIVKDINPDPRLHYFRRPKEEKNVGYGYPRFIPLQRILSDDSEFVSTDSIFIRATVYH